MLRKASKFSKVAMGRMVMFPEKQNKIKPQKAGERVFRGLGIRLHRYQHQAEGCSQDCMSHQGREHKETTRLSPGPLTSSSL